MKNTRKWLERDSLSYVATQLDAGEFFKTAEVSISDGTNVVNFYESIDTDRERKAARRKLLVMLEAITNLVSEIDNIEDGLDD